MRHEKIIKREDGTQYQICINIHLDSYRTKRMQYRCELYCREKGKKKWLNVPDTLHEYQFRSLSMEDREKHRNQNILRFVTKEEIYQAKLEVWEMLKPEM